MKKLALFTTCLMTMTPALVLAQTTLNPSPAYQECSTLASTNPAQALAKAEAWLKIDTGIAAQHCRAMALYGLARYPEAGEALTAVRDAISPENIGLRSYLARQISRAWINANRTESALNILNVQITEISNFHNDNATAAKLTSDLLLDRARLQITYGKLDDATKDLDHAVSLTPINEDVLMERAGVFEKLGDKPLARADAEVVMKLNSSNNAAREMLQRLGGLPQASLGLTPPPAAAPVEDAPKPMSKSYHKRSYKKPATKPVSKSEAP